MMDFLSNRDELCVRVDSPNFSICDDADAEPAYVDLEGGGRGCKVSNPDRKQLVFRPVDRALYGSADHSRCDAFLRTEDLSDTICFIELKDWKVSGWYKHGVEQLQATIDDFKSSHPKVFESVRRRSAYVVNIRKNSFSHAHIETMRDFVRKNRFILRETQPVRI